MEYGFAMSVWNLQSIFRGGGSQNAVTGSVNEDLIAGALQHV
jgi:hypothetical protein